MMIETKVHPGEILQQDMLKEIEKVYQLIKEHGISLEAKVHEIRKAIKRLRASLRLVKNALSERSYYKLDDILARSARGLSEMRDATISLRTFIELFHNSSNSFSSGLSGKVLKQLTANINKAYNNNQTLSENRFASTSFHLRQVKNYLEEMNFSHINTEAIGDSIDKVMIKTYNAFNDAVYSMDTEIIHNWRKYAKSLLLQLKLAPADTINKNSLLIGSLSKLTNILGDDHDLANLESVIRNMNDVEEQDKKNLYLAISKTRARIQKKAFQTGETLFARESISETRSMILL